MCYGRAYGKYMESVQVDHPRAYTLWTYNDERVLRVLHRLGYSVKAMAKQLQRQDSAIISRLEKLELPVPGQEEMIPKKPEKRFMVVRVDPGSGNIRPVTGNIAYSADCLDAAVKSALQGRPRDSYKLYLIESNVGLFDDAIVVSEIIVQDAWSLRSVT